MNNKEPTFLIADDPYNEDVTCVVRLSSPVMICQAFHYHEDSIRDYMKIQKRYNIRATVEYGNEIIVLGYIFCEQNQLDQDQLAKLMSQMGDWYYNCLEFEDQKN